MEGGGSCVSPSRTSVHKGEALLSVSTRPDIYRIPQVDHIEEETLSIFTSQTDKFCVIYTCMQIMLYWESQGPRSQLLFKLSCLVIFVLLKEVFNNNTGYSVCRLCIIAKFLLIAGSRCAMYCS